MRTTNERQRTFGAHAVRRERWWDMLSCWLLSSSALMLIDTLFRFRLSAVELCVHALVLTFVMLLVGRRVWVWPVVIGVGLGVVVLYLAAAGRLGTVWAELLGILDWWAHRFPIPSPYDRPEVIRLVQWLIHGAVCAVVCVLVRALRQEWTPGILLLALAVVVLGVGFVPDAAALPLGVIGWLMLLAPRIKAGRRHGRIAVCLLGAVAALAALFLLPPRLPNLGKWEFPVWEERGGLQGSDKRGHDPMESMGLQQENRLGGTFLPERDDEILRVDSPEAGLMRVGVYTTYHGDSWSRELANWQSITTADLWTAPGGEPTDGGRKNAMHITLRQPSDVLPVSGRVVGIGMGAGAPAVQMNNRWELILTVPTGTFFSYRLDTYIYDKDGALMPLWEETVNRTIYEQLPNDLPASVRQTAASIVASAGDSDADKADALYRYLREHYHYTLTPENLPEGRDFVEYFLETGEGYCTYYASAMTVMARTLGIPARLVVGYGLEETAVGRFVAYQHNAHAWVECYIEGRGWVTYDPTPAGYQNGVMGGQTPPEDDPTVSATETTATVPTATETTASAPDTPPGVTTTTAVVSGTGHGAAWPRWLLPAFGVLFLLLLLVAWRLTVYRRAYDLETVRRRFAATDAQMRWYFRDIQRQTALLGVPLLRGETLTQWKERASVLSPHLAAAVTAVEASVYGETAPSAETVALLSAARAELEAQLKQRLPGRVYVWRRVLWL